MILYPVLLNLQGKDCLIVGGGNVARRKIEHLLEAGARVRVVAARAATDIQRWASVRRIQWVRGAYRPEVLEPRPRLVFACTDDARVNARVEADARKRGIEVNRADDPEGGDFHIPSMVRRGNFLVTVSTGGEAPALAREVCHRLEQQFGPSWAEFTELLGGLRRRWKVKGEAGEIHTRMLEILASDAFEVLQTRGKAAARRKILEMTKPRTARRRTRRSPETEPLP